MEAKQIKSVSFVINGERFSVTMDKRAKPAGSGLTIDLRPIQPLCYEISLTGDAPNGCGQIVDTLAEAGQGFSDVARLSVLWKQFHLGGMNAGTRAQMAHLATLPAVKNFDEAKDALRHAGLEPDRNTHPDIEYAYGSKWLHNQMSDADYRELCDVLDRLNGTRLGEAPDVGDAPECKGDLIDSRDIIARLEIYREAMIAIGFSEERLLTLNDENFDIDGEESFAEGHDDLVEEFIILRDIDAEEPGEEWKYGATLIRETHFVDYAQQLADDIGAVDTSAAWPMKHIDWEAAAYALEQDYTSVYFRGDRYLVR